MQRDDETKYIFLFIILEQVVNIIFFRFLIIFRRKKAQVFFI